MSVLMLLVLFVVEVGSTLGLESRIREGAKLLPLRQVLTGAFTPRLDNDGRHRHKKGTCWEKTEGCAFGKSQSGSDKNINHMTICARMR